jgi:hypothetical protein
MFGSDLLGFVGIDDGRTARAVPDHRLPDDSDRGYP